eukprot:TRINITY_DN13797_c0_g1_i3.p1 TRINITY_DN13797_c0_g1~~TRINITY_DN13797_c0_g1_i3.p1  ORF type:complete len:291 (+),score=72.38 TRINITY_DN13797_c0_g1_i3:145-1017(+)
MIRRPPRSTLSSSSAASDVYKRQGKERRIMHKAAWSCLGVLPSRSLASMWFSKATLCYFDSTGSPGVRGYFALTMDDAPCRGGEGESLMAEVLALLERYEAKATFMICSSFVAGNEEGMRAAVAAGHELANHMPEDRKYSSDPYDEVCASLDETSRVIEQFQPGRVRWFRAPHGKISGEMEQALQERGMTNVMVDCYANDPHIPDATFIAEFMLKRLQSGSIALIHMPEKSVRRWNLEALELLLHGAQQMGLKPVTIGQLAAHAQAGAPEGRQSEGETQGDQSATPAEQQ